jgi:hypothetical protein
MLGFLLDEHRPVAVDGAGRSDARTAQQHIGLGSEHLLGQRRIAHRNHRPESQHRQGHHRPEPPHGLGDQLLAAKSVGHRVETAEDRRQRLRCRQCRWTHVKNPATGTFVA